MTAQSCGGVFSRSRQVAACLVVLTSFTLAGFWLGSRQDTSGATTGGLTIAEEALDFGEVWAQRDFQWTLPIHNRTGTDIEILDIRASCQCALVDPRSCVIPAGRAVPVRLELDLTTADLEEASRPSRPFDVELLPVVKGRSTGEVRWRVEGRVHRYPLVLSPPFLDFGESLVQGSPSPRGIVNVKCSQPVTSLTAQCDESLAAVRVRQPDKGRGEFQVEVSPRSNLSKGKHDFTVDLKAVLKDGKRERELPALPLRVTVHVTSGVQVVPRNIMFGGAKVGEIVEDTVTFSSRAKGFVVSEVERGAADSFEVTPIGESQDGARLFRVLQRVSKVGFQRSEVAFLVREEGTEQSYEVSIPIYYHGLPE